MSSSIQPIYLGSTGPGIAASFLGGSIPMLITDSAKIRWEKFKMQGKIIF
jgi:hypothetical protein